jgi:hypothetical protein
MTNRDHLGTLVQGVETILRDLEHRLLDVIHRGGRGSVDTDGVLDELDRVVPEIRRAYVPLHESLERRDLGFELASRLQATRGRCLWLYRKSRLEQCFFTKLRLERGLRDAIYAQIVETNEEISSIEETERELRGCLDDALAGELVQATDTIRSPE